jgi:hypothetical protein
MYTYIYVHIMIKSYKRYRYNQIFQLRRPPEHIVESSYECVRMFLYIDISIYTYVYAVKFMLINKLYICILCIDISYI